MNLSLIASFIASHDMNEKLYSFSKQQIYYDVSLAIATLADGYSPKNFSKFGKASAVAPAYWPFELTPLDSEYCYISDLLFKNSAKLPVGKFSSLFNPEKKFRANNGTEFLNKLKNGLDELEKPKTYEFRNENIHGLLDPLYFTSIKPFFMNLGHLFFDSFFILNWDLQKIKHKDIHSTLGAYFNTTPEKELRAIFDDTQTLINKWIEKLKEELSEARSKGKNNELEKEKEKLEKDYEKLQAKQLEDRNELIKAGKVPFPNLDSKFENELNGMQAATSNLRTTCKSRNVIKVESYVSELKSGLNYLFKALSRFESDLINLNKNADNQAQDEKRAKEKEERDLDRQIKELQRRIDDGEQSSNKKAENIRCVIEELKEISKNLSKYLHNATQTIDSIRQTIVNQTLLPIKSNNLIIGLPVYVFLFGDQRNGIRIPVLPQIIDLKERGHLKTSIDKIHRNLLEDMYSYLNSDRKRIEEVDKRCIQQNVLEYGDAKRSIEQNFDRLNTTGVISNKARKKAFEFYESLIK